MTEGGQADAMAVLEERIAALEERCAEERSFAAEREAAWRTHTKLMSEWCEEMVREMNRLKGILIGAAGIAGTARDRPNPAPPPPA